MISIHYLAVLPKVAEPAKGRVIPRSIDGSIIYQTPQENQQINMAEYGSMKVFTIGVLLNAALLEKSAGERAIEKENALAGHKV